MKRSIATKSGMSVWILLCVAALVSGCQRQAANSASARRLFEDPPRQYRSAPLWVWNDMLTAEQIRSTMRDLADQKVRQVFVHPRPGLMTPYLSDDWFRLWKVALREAEKLDMNVWIYDENSYPSGFAGGLVPDAMPESRGKTLTLEEAKTPPSLNDGIVAVFRLTEEGYENITGKIRAGETFGQGRYLTASIRLAPAGGWFGGPARLVATSRTLSTFASSSDLLIFARKRNWKSLTRYAPSMVIVSACQVFSASTLAASFATSVQLVPSNRSTARYSPLSKPLSIYQSNDSSALPYGVRSNAPIVVSVASVARPSTSAE